MVLRETWILFAFIVAPSVCQAEVACDPPSSMANWDTKEPVDDETLADVQRLSDHYTKLWLSEYYPEAKQYWIAERDDFNEELFRPFGFGAKLGKDVFLEWTQFERVFAVNEAYGKTGYYIVTEYGSRTNKFDVLHGMVWAPTEFGWKVLHTYYTLRCGPDSAPVELSPNKALHLPLQSRS